MMLAGIVLTPFAWYFAFSLAVVSRYIWHSGDYPGRDNYRLYAISPKELVPGWTGKI